MKETLKRILLIISILMLCMMLIDKSIAINMVDLDKQKKEVSERLNQKNKQLEYVKEELTTALLEIQKLEDEILQYETNLTKYEAQISKLQKSIDNAIDKIEIAQEDCETREEILRDRLVEMYKAGDVTYLDVLLSSKSLTEFISSSMYRIFLFAIGKYLFSKNLLKFVSYLSFVCLVIFSLFYNHPVQISMLSVFF